jgi:hypothetical protein
VAVARGRVTPLCSSTPASKRHGTNRGWVTIAPEHPGPDVLPRHGGGANVVRHQRALLKATSLDSLRIGRGANQMGNWCSRWQQRPRVRARAGDAGSGKLVGREKAAGLKDEAAHILLLVGPMVRPQRLFDCARSLPSARSGAGAPEECRRPAEPWIIQAPRLSLPRRSRVCCEVLGVILIRRDF